MTGKGVWESKDFECSFCRVLSLVSCVALNRQFISLSSSQFFICKMRELEVEISEVLSRIRKNFHGPKLLE